MSDTSTSKMSHLFDGESRITNIKLYPGHSNDSTKQRIDEQVQRVFSEIENGALDPIEFDD